MLKFSSGAKNVEILTFVADAPFYGCLIKGGIFIFRKLMEYLNASWNRVKLLPVKGLIFDILTE